MQWNSLSDFLDMGGYALYVWGSFGATAVCMAAELWLLRVRRLAVEAQLRNDRGISSQNRQEAA